MVDKINMIKKWFGRFCIGTSISMLFLLCFSLVVLAIPSSVTDLVATQITSTSISLRWTLAESSNSTVIRYLTTGFPATPAGGTSAYSGTASYCTLSGLVAGQTYYFAAWGYDGSDYSASSLERAFTTESTTTGNITIPYESPAMPAEVWQDPDTSGWSISPIDDVIDYFSDPSATHGGLGMPVNNVVMFMSGVGVAFVGLSTYVKWRSFFTSWFLVFVLCFAFALIGVMQYMVIIFLLVIGAGVWAINNSLQ